MVDGCLGEGRSLVDGCLGGSGLLVDGCLGEGGSLVDGCLGGGGLLVDGCLGEGSSLVDGCLGGGGLLVDGCLGGGGLLVDGCLGEGGSLVDGCLGGGGLLVDGCLGEGSSLVDGCLGGGGLLGKPGFLCDAGGSVLAIGPSASGLECSGFSSPAGWSVFLGVGTGVAVLLSILGTFVPADSNCALVTNILLLFAFGGCSVFTGVFSLSSKDEDFIRGGREGGGGRFLTVGGDGVGVVLGLGLGRGGESLT